MTKIIVAYDQSRTIGSQGKLPWHLSADLKHFRRSTLHQVIIMGRKTFQALPDAFRPLPGRTTVVLTRDPSWASQGVLMASSLEEAIEQHPDAWIAGGGEVYREALEMGLVDEILATEVVGFHQGDTYFPELPGGWDREVIETSADFQIARYSRSPQQDR